MKFVIVTGMSGAGKSTAMKMMEDMGYFCIDNLPIQLLDKLIDFSNTFHSDVSKVAVGIDVRNGSGIDAIPQTLEQLRQKNFPYEILFLDAEDEVLVKRYKRRGETILSQAVSASIRASCLRGKSCSI